VLRWIVLCLSLTFTFTLLSSCGFVVMQPDECRNEIPFTGAHDFFVQVPRPKKNILGIEIPEVLPPKASTKDEFLKEWGTPDEIITYSKDHETWVYKRNLWCGIILVYFIPAPLILPVCDGFDRITFTGNEAINLHTRKTVSVGLVIPLAGGGDPVCRFPYFSGKEVPNDAGNSPTEPPPNKSQERTE
jgi:hypothetical protein